MIHTVTVLAGDSGAAEAAQQHALRMAQWFGARLRVVTTSGPGDSEVTSESGQFMERLGVEAVEHVKHGAVGGGVTVESRIRGEGLLDGLLAEARESDLLVIGLLPEPDPGADHLLQAVRHAELPLLHRAECLVLVVSCSPRPITRILVDYQGGSQGKAALRIAGEVALHASASVTVLAVDGDPSKAELLTAAAASYLAAFALPSVVTVAQVGQPGSATELAAAVRSAGADMVVIGSERHGVLNWLRDRRGPDPDEVALFTQIPVLIAR